MACTSTYLFLLCFVLKNVLSEAPVPQPVPLASTPEPSTPPNFSDTYVVKGTLYIPYAEIREPFFAWYDLTLGSSRIDYYGGMVKTYQLSKEGKYGSLLKMAPVTTEKQSNVDTCLQVNGTSGSTVVPQSILPDLSGFKFLGQDLLNGHDCEKWRLVDTKGDKVNKYTIWLRYKSSLNNGVKTAIPLKYEMKGYNTLLGSHYDHYYLMYEWFSPDKPKPDVFQISPIVGFQLGVNHLADRTDTELKALRGKQYSEGYNGGAPFPYTNVKEMVKDIPSDLDWRLYGAVTPVKDQSVCGSCWSFGTTGTIEGAYFLKYGHQVRLSQQALIDCSWGFGNNGCDGGEDFRSYQWMMKHGGLPLEDEYGGYLGQDGYCHADNATLTAKITGYVNVTSGDADALKVALAKNGPISIAIDASRKTFSFYSNGIYYDPQCHNKPDQLDHAVLLVGYGTMNGNPYWLVKNSWSNYWGNDGYILISQKNNNCGVETDPTYVTM
ncbi:hypothetical protein C0J52_02135 [Blattella germanica]|nr:hypothetical protein C0J52_02135 [Blattella germanica]